MSPSPAVEFIEVGKRFGGVSVLRQVSFDLPAGQTLGLIGENGAGKSTLMNLLGGNLALDTGRIQLAGQPHRPATPADAARAGIAFIHQELNLFPNLTIAENIFLTTLPIRTGLPVIDRATLHRRAEILLAQVSLDLAPGTLVEALSAGQCQLVEIARALGQAARLIIFDEPTTSLSTRETKALFAVMARLRDRGIGMIYISHILSDVLQLSDKIVVLRDGEVVGQGPRREFTSERLITLMVGRSLTQLYPTRRGAATTQRVLEVKGVSEPHMVRDLNFCLHQGEVLGIAGLMGAGRSEFARILFGLDPHGEGEIYLGDSRLRGLTPARRIELGLAFLTEDRRGEGLCLDASIGDNLTLVSLREHSRGPVGLLDFESWRAAWRTMREAVRLTLTTAENKPVRTLSGGNQQKVVLGKWLLSRPQVLILDEPTRGVDVGAKFELYQLILDLADRGMAVLLISSELEELMGLCDRVLVMCRGEITGEMTRANFDREQILAAALPREEISR